MANSAVFLCSAFLQLNYQGLAGNYPAITQRSGELPVIYLTANNTKSRTRRELRNQTSWGTCKWKKSAVTAAKVLTRAAGQRWARERPQELPSICTWIVEWLSPWGRLGPWRS